MRSKKLKDEKQDEIKLQKLSVNKVFRSTTILIHNFRYSIIHILNAILIRQAQRRNESKRNKKQTQNLVTVIQHKRHMHVRHCAHDRCCTQSSSSVDVVGLYPQTQAQAKDKNTRNKNPKRNEKQAKS